MSSHYCGGKFYVSNGEAFFCTMFTLVGGVGIGFIIGITVMGWKP